MTLSPRVLAGVGAVGALLLVGWFFVPSIQAFAEAMGMVVAALVLVPLDIISTGARVTASSAKTLGIAAVVLFVVVMGVLGALLAEGPGGER